MIKKNNVRKKRIKMAIAMLTGIVIVAILIEMQITWMISRNSAEKSTALLLNQVENVLINNEEETKDRTADLKESYVSYAQAIAYILDAKPEIIENMEELKEIASLQQIDEIHIFDETGTIISGTVPEYYGYSFDSGEQMGYFKPMLTDKSLTMCQDVTPNTAEGKSMMYAIVWNREGTFMVQVGIEPKRLLAELKDNEIENVINNIPITTGFDIYIVDRTTGEIAACTNKNDLSNITPSSFAGAIGSASSGSGSGIIRYNGKSYFCNYRPTDEYIVAVAYSMSNSAGSITVSLVVMAIYLIIAGIGILRLFTRLYKAEDTQAAMNENLKKAVQSLQEEEDIIRAAGHGIWRCPIDEDSHVIGMIGNEQWKQIFGIENTEMTPQECLQYYINGLVKKENNPQNFDYSYLKPGEVIHMTFAWNHPVKGVIYVEVAGTRHISENGEVQVSGYAADITEQTISKMQWEKELLDARAKAEAANKAKTTFLFNMSHDIRTPMNAIIGFTALMEKYYDDKEKCMDYLHKTQEANKFLLSLINNVLEMARIESGNVTLTEERQSTEQFYNALTSVFEEQMNKKHIRFNRTIDIQHPYIWCDSVKLREIFLNIISNAYKYTPEGGSVTFNLKELPSDRDGCALYRTTISDTGIGMSSEFLPHLFEEFSRAKSATDSRTEGTGLGMSIVKKYVELMGGTIEVESEPDKGSTFVVSIYHRISDEISIEETDSKLPDKEFFEGKRILLAEDNDLNAEIAEDILTDAGFKVERAEDGVICIDMLKRAEPHYYDLILMDIQMPNMNGYDTTKSIRSIEDKEKAEIPIIAMTANAFESDKENALAAGMNGHVAKPIEIRTLMQALADVFRARS